MNGIEQKIVELLRDGEKTQRELREKLNISKSYLSEILQKMEKEGIIKREKISERTVVVKINKEKVLNIGILKATEYAAVFLTIKDLNNYNIKLHAFNNSLEEMGALLTGNIDIAFAPLITGFIFHLIDSRIVVLSACARGGSGIVYHEKNGVLGSTMFSTMDLQSRFFKDEFKSIRYFQSPDEMLKHFKNKSVDAISIWEPYLSILRENSKIIPGKKELCCGLITLKDRINRIIKKFYQEFIKNTMAISKNERIDEASELMADFFKIEKEIILESLKNYIFTNEIDENELQNAVMNFGISINKDLIKDYIKKI